MKIGQIYLRLNFRATVRDWKVNSYYHAVKVCEKFFVVLLYLAIAFVRFHLLSLSRDRFGIISRDKWVGDDINPETIT